jgi:hypothetical protein
VKILQLLWSRHCPMVNISQLNCQLHYSSIASQPPLQNSEMIAITTLVITSRHGPHTKYHSSILACTFVAAGTRLPRCYPEMGCITPFIDLLPHQRVSFHDLYPATGVYMLQYVYANPKSREKHSLRQKL